MLQKVVVEIRAAEGGMDAKMLVNEMATIYKKACSVNNFHITSFN